jgi:hypothetical protein
MRSDFLKFGLLVGVSFGFVAGKLNADEKIRQAIQDARIRQALLEATIMLNEIEARALKAAPPGD